MKEKIDKFIEYFTTITKEECDYIESIIRWDDETRAAFFLAKSIFEEKDIREVENDISYTSHNVCDRCDGVLELCTDNEPFNEDY